MATWYYVGGTPTPVSIPGRGSVVIKPRSKFEAPESSVALLLKARLVKRLPDPKPESVADFSVNPMSIESGSVGTPALEAVRQPSNEVKAVEEPGESGQSSSDPVLDSSKSPAAADEAEEEVATDAAKQNQQTETPGRKKRSSKN